MRFLFRFICILFLFASGLYSQSISFPVSSGEKFNKRGFYKNEDAVLNGKEVISDYDGNLMLNYISHLDLSNDLSGDFSVTYNPNVEHRTFWADDGTSAGYSINAPEWILGYKGFAVQTTNFETNFNIRHNDQLDISTFYSGEEIPLLIPGFHYSNCLVSMPGNSRYDVITILRADGSKIILQNTRPNDIGVSYNPRIGLYNEIGLNTHGFAIVDLYDNTDEPLPVGSKNHYRRVWYKPGDGYTYVFDEKKANFNYTYPIQEASPDAPKALYLTQIYTPFSYFTSRYRLELVYGTNLSTGSICNGRKLFVGLRKSLDDGNVLPYDLFLSYGYDGANMLNIVVNNYANNDKLTLNLTGGSDRKINPNTVLLNPNAKLNSLVRDKYNSRILCVSSIKDNMGRTDNFKYNSWSNTNTQRRYSYGGKFHLDAKANLISENNYFNGKTSKFVYYGQTYPGVSCIDPELGFRLDFSDQCISCNLQKSNRDCFSNFMLQTYQEYNAYNGDTSLVKYTNYDYTIKDTTFYVGKMRATYTDRIDSMKTIMTEYDKNNELLRTIIKNYSNIKSSSWDMNSADRSYSLKLMSEIIKDSESNRNLEKNYKYDLGKYDSLRYFFDGTFDTREIKEIKRDYPSSNYTVKIDSIFNTYDQKDIIFDNTANSKLTKKIKLTETEKDSKGLVHYTEFLNLFPSQNLDTYSNSWLYYDCYQFYYKLGLVKEDKIYKGSSIKSDKFNEYNERGILGGRLAKSTTNYASGRETYSSFTYSTDTEYGGLITSITNDDATRQEYFYPKYSGGVFRDTAYGNIIQYNLTKTWSPFVHCGFQMKPFKTLTIYKNSLGIYDTLVNYTSYNSDGTLRFDVDQNQNHSSYAYDNIGRLIAAALPTSFVDGSTPFGINDYFSTKVNYSLDNKNISASGIPLYITRLKNYNSNSEYRNFGYCFFPKSITPSSKPVKKITLKFDAYYTQNFPSDLSKILLVQGISGWYKDPIDYPGFAGIQVDLSGTTAYQVTSFEIDLTTMIQNIGTASLNGLKFSIPMIDLSEYSQAFEIVTTPTLTVVYDVPGALPGPTIDKQSGTTGAVVYTYDDANNKVEEKRRINSDPLNRIELSTTEEFDSFGEVRKTFIKNETGVQELKKQSTYNPYGLLNQSTDGEGRSTTISYDYLQRPVSEAKSDTTNKTVEYFEKPGTLQNGTLWQTNYAFYTKTVDENRDTSSAVYTYYDIVGNKVAEKIGGNKPTVYQYDSIYRLYKVISPAGKIKTYYYDSISNLSQKESPADEGTVYYKYDKYNRLRFTAIEGAQPNDRGITFIKYDAFGRVLATGTLPSSFGFNNMDPDKDYTVNQNLSHFEDYQADTANFVVVNMYDKYKKSSIFAKMTDPFSWSMQDANSSRNLKGKIVLTAFRDRPGQAWNYKIYLYDYLGNVSHHYVKIGNNPWRYIFKEEDILGNQKRENIYKISGGSSVGEFFSWNNYDKQARLIDVRTDPNGSYSSAKVEASYTYNKADQCSTLTYNQVSGTNNKVTYNYSPSRGWLGSIANGNNFYEGLRYYKNGNINTQSLTNSAFAGVQNLSYTYDSMNRLLNVTNGATQVESFTYFDDDGNFASRNYQGNNGIGYSYMTGTNKLSTVYLNGQVKSYSYDYMGNVTVDQSNNITNITYDHRNLPLSITSSGNTSKYSYNDHGNRIFKETPVYNGAQWQIKKEYYLRDDKDREVAVYDMSADKLSQINLYGTDQIGRIEVSWTSQWDDIYEQWVETRSDKKIYFIKDHLGSIRQSIDQAGSLVSANDYYAFGQIKNNTVVGQTTDKYKYTGKERDLETGLDYFGARYYDSRIGRWLSVDPLADKYPGWNPYQYCHNTPINNIDQNGMWDIKVNFHADRRAFPFGVATLYDRNGKALFSWAVRGQGTQPNRLKWHGDTPTGVYKIIKWDPSPDRAMYGPNHVLLLKGISGEALKAYQNGRSGIMFHGGRQEGTNEDGDWDYSARKDIDSKGFLKITYGCLRTADVIMDLLYNITTKLEKNDPEEKAGKVEVNDNLENPNNAKKRLGSSNTTNGTARDPWYNPGGN